MASKDRILRQKEKTRVNILNAACQIVKNEGWQGLSMRKIADAIEYTAPIIYEYFSNKDAILLELTKQGYNILNKEIEKAKEAAETPSEQLEAMWMAFWDFAFANRELYQLMYGVEMTCCSKKPKEAEVTCNLYTSVIKKIMHKSNPSDEVINQKHITFFAVILGLISINMVDSGLSNSTNHQILKDAIGGIIKSIE